MKRVLLVIGVLVCVGGNAFAAGAESDDTYMEKMKHKTHRGLRNLLSSEMVVPQYVDIETEKHGEKKGKVFGIIRGSNMIAVRKVVGLLDVLTAPLPFDIYVFNPEIPGEEMRPE